MRKIALFILLLIFIIFIMVFLGRYSLKLLYPLKYSDYIEKYSDTYHIDKHLVYAIIKAESNFDSNAVSPKNAKGLMQLLDSTGEWAAKKADIKDFSDEMLLNPETNINIGCWYFSYLMSKYHQDRQLALAAYNAGSGNVAKWLKDSSLSHDGKKLNIIPFDETNNYVKRVNKYYKMYKSLYGESK